MVEDSVPLLIWLLITFTIFFSPILLAFGILYLEIILPKIYQWCKRHYSRLTKNVFFGKFNMSAPSEFLKDLIGNPVVVKLNSGVDYRGILNCLDGYMNIALEQTEEYVNGQLKKKYGDAFIRGNNVLYISRQKRRA